MPSLKEIKGRIASVKSTRKITSAMKMVASSKLHHAQVAIENMLPYETLLEHILKTFLASDADVRSMYVAERPVKRVAFIVYSSNSSLCGGFNANVIREMQKAVEEYQYLGKDNIIIYPIGRKIAEKARKLGYNIAGSDISREIGGMYKRCEIDRVEMIFHHFKSAGSQILTRKTFLPIDIEGELNSDKERDLKSNVATRDAVEYLRKRDMNKGEKKNENDAVPLNDNFIVEPDLTSVMERLIPKLAHLMLYTALLDSIASEHAARMVAMQTATDNADEILRDLNLQYNKSRQQAITSELLDIVGGSLN